MRITIEGLPMSRPCLWVGLKHACLTIEPAHFICKSYALSILPCMLLAYVLTIGCYPLATTVT